MSTSKLQPALLAPLDEAALHGLTILPAGAVRLRRDIHLFIDFVQRFGIKRSHRGNEIPKAPALKLAKILSWTDGTGNVEADQGVFWSDVVSRLARALDLVKFDVEGVYLGHSSSEPSFPDNHILIHEERWAAWLAQTPHHKERAILTTLVTQRASEFFHRATLVGGDRFATFGSAIGPASRMNLPHIREKLLEMLAELPPGEWFATRDLTAHVRAKAPALILDPKLKIPPDQRQPWEMKGPHARPPPAPEDLYANFREGTAKDPWSRSGQLLESTPDVFARVEGRYLQFFLTEIPYLCGFVDLAVPPPRKPKPDDPTPALDQVRAFRVTDRLRQVLRAEPELSRVSVTVLANFDVHVEAPSYPDREIGALSPFCKIVKEDGPTHLLHLDRAAVTAHAAKSPKGASARAVIEGLSSRPLPPNVASELDAWSSHPDKLLVYEEIALIELRGNEGLQAQVRAELGALVVDDQLPGFLIVRDPARAVSVLEQRGRVPVLVLHTDGFAAPSGPLGARQVSARPKKQRPEPPPKRRAVLTAQDLIGVRSETPELLAALHKQLEAAGVASRLLDKGALLLVPASDLGQMRACLKPLEERFDVQIERATSSPA